MAVAEIPVAEVPAAGDDISAAVAVAVRVAVSAPAAGSCGETYALPASAEAPAPAAKRDARRPAWEFPDILLFTAILQSSGDECPVLWPCPAP
mmetsp:Transcript_59160/g.95685  ORF Transcript_59160/g.95685 Transcript_59160/m.95685 type:complete len:93 (+) Transcript_59160:613-891(+)